MHFPIPVGDDVDEVLHVAIGAIEVAGHLAAPVELVIGPQPLLPFQPPGQLGAGEGVEQADIRDRNAGVLDTAGQ